MTSPSRKLDVDADFEVKRRDYPLSVRITVAPGEQVVVCGNFEATDDDPDAGWATEHPMAVTGNTAKVVSPLPGLIVGKKYEYKIFVKDASGNRIREYPPGGPGTNKLITIPHEPGSSPAEIAEKERIEKERTEAIKVNVGSRVKDVVEGLRTYEGVQGIDALMERLEVDMEAMGMSGDHTKLILDTIGKVFGEMETLPAVTRNKFKGKPAPATFDELKTRLREGSTAYRWKVFLALVADKKAREALHLEPNSRDFHDEHTKAAFRRVCNQFDLGDTVDYIGVAFDSVHHVPPNDPALTNRRRSLMSNVLHRLEAHNRSPGILGRIPAGRWGKMLDVTVQLGLAGLLFTGTAPAAGAIGLAGKALWEITTGLGTTNIVESLKGDGHSGHGGHKKGLWGTFMENNIVSRMLTTEGKAADVLKTRFKDCLKRMIPFTSFSYGGEAVGGDHGHEEQHEEHHEEVDVEPIIRTACEKELK